MTLSTGSHLERERREKIERLRQAGLEPYPWQFAGRVPTSLVVDHCRALSPGASDETKAFRVAGRLTTIRSHGKTTFLDIEDRSGALQLFLRVDDLGEAAYEAQLSVIDPGDIVGADGVAMVSKRGEPSLRVRALSLLSKAIAPPPEKFHGLKDPEERLRRRYVDLLSSAESRRRFQARSEVERTIRNFLDEREFLGVETAVLLPVASGGTAAPFSTHSNYLDEEVQLRIALELPLKRLLVGGLERVYEIGACFRNEDLDSTHSPEFTMLELYWAYADYLDMLGLVEELLVGLARRMPELLPDLPTAREAPDLFRPPFERVDFVEELEKRSGISDLLSRDREQLRDLARAAGATVPDDSPAGVFLDKLFEHYVEPSLQRPTFVMDFPEATTPLAKRHRSRPGRVERFELFCRGYEIGNAYTELNDPDEQERRFREQLSSRVGETYAFDEDFVEALRYGMPPTAGFGGGIERIFMALSGVTSIKDTILFVTARSRPTRTGPASPGSEAGPEAPRPG
jgi:lysyl-tRNA synthetase, class II